MKKSSPTPKEISKKRIIRSQIMKVANNDGNFYCNENMPPASNVYKRNLKSNNSIKSESLVTDDKANPFAIPNHLRMFSYKKVTRKVKPKPFIMSEPRTICDIDNTFFETVTKSNKKPLSDIKVYMRNIRDITHYRADVGYLKDQTVMLDTIFSTEMIQYNKIVKVLKTTHVNFINFVRDAYNKAKLAQDRAEQKSLELAEITDLLQAYSSEFVVLRNEVGSIVFYFESLLNFGEFLNAVSPNWWREQFDNLNTSSTEMRKKVEATVSNTFLEKYIANVAQLTETKPQIFFTKPAELMSVFDNISRQCQHYMEIDVLTSSIIHSIKRKRNSLNTALSVIIQDSNELVEAYEKKIVYLEEKEKAYENVFNRILMNEFQKLYASADSIKLFTCVQFVYTKIIGSAEDPKDRISVMMCNLEKTYFQLMLDLDSLNQDVVKSATKQIFTQDVQIMSRALKAQRALKECNIFRNSLYTSFEPPRQNKIHEIKKKPASAPLR